VISDGTILDLARAREAWPGHPIAVAEGGEMRARVVLFSLLAILEGAGFAYAAGPRYYLALGDSMSVGLQPTGRGSRPTNQGYADDLYEFYRVRMPGLRLAKLGCPEETTTTMIVGGICSYPLGSQLLQAINFLQTHEVAFVTIDIGANNVLGCITAGGRDLTCFNNGINAAVVDLPQILAALQAIAPGVPIFGMNYYDPFLGVWAVNPTFAVNSLTLTLVFNNALGTIYQSFNVPIADVAAAYHITDFTPVPVIGLPLNAFLTLAWTWMGAPPPLGPNVHPNAMAYGVIAGAFVRVIGT
jgi:lysophospholipase L1-like esterase